MAQSVAQALPELPQTVAECHAVITQLIERVRLLEERVSLNSRNSSKPPSSDGPGSGGNRAQRRASERKRGAQPGHKGHSRALVDESAVDGIIECKPEPVCVWRGGGR